MSIKTLAFLQGYTHKAGLQKSAAMMPLSGSKESFLKGLYPNAKINPMGVADPVPEDVGSVHKRTGVDSLSMDMTTGQDAFHGA